MPTPTPAAELTIGFALTGEPFEVSRDSIRAFSDASLDFNPLHWDDEYMKGSFGRTQFGGIIMHVMNNFGIISKMLTDWLHATGGTHRRLETRWRTPVKPGDTITPRGRVTALKRTRLAQLALLEIEVRNQRDETVATGEAMVELPVRD